MMPFERIVCPFCFNAKDSGLPFSHNEVHFRVDDRSLESGGAYSNAQGGLGLFADSQEESDGGAKTGYVRERDDAFRDFWTDLNDVPPLMNPVIGGGAGTLHKGSFSQAGMLVSVLDKKGNIASDRLCPHCHSSLPMNYGLFDTVTIAVVGITGSGKTVYLSSLLKNIQGLMQRSCGLSAMPSDYAKRFCRERFAIKEGVALPSGTVGEHMPMDLITVDISCSGGSYGSSIKPRTLVLYDIAGENCVDPKKMEKYGPFIRHSDGIIMLVNPYQVEYMGGHLDGDKSVAAVAGGYEPQDVIDTMYNAFLADRYGGGESPTPLAITFAQSDRLSDFPDDANIFRQTQYKSHGFNISDHRNLASDLRRKVFRESDGLSGSRKRFAHSELFAVSSLGRGAELRKTGGCVIVKRLGDPLRIEEPLVWVLSKLGIVGAFEDNGEPERRPLFGGLFGRKK